MWRYLEKRFAGAFCFVFLGLLVPNASASVVDFVCSGSGVIACTGSVVVSGQSFSSAGISVFNTTGEYLLTNAFSLAFNTTTGNISLTAGPIILSGVIQRVDQSPGPPTVLDLHALWNNLAGATAIQKSLGGPIGVDAVALTYSGTTNTITNATIAILPVPEPASLLLLGSGLVVVGGYLRRRWRQESVSGDLGPER